MQVFLMTDDQSLMPMWAPPTPPHDSNDLYLDHAVCSLYETTPILETALPPVHVKMPIIKMRTGPKIVKPTREDASRNKAPRSLFERQNTMPRRDKMMRLKAQQAAPTRPSEGQTELPDWYIHEDWALLRSVQALMKMPLSLTVVSPAHVVNWDLVAEVVNASSRIYRSPKQCKTRYDQFLVPREEGRPVPGDTAIKRHKKQMKTLLKNKTTRPVKTNQLYTQDAFSMLTAMHATRFDVAHQLSDKRLPAKQSVSTSLKNSKVSTILSENGINYEKPLSPIEVAQNRQERITREKKVQQSQRTNTELATRQNSTSASTATTNLTMQSSGVTAGSAVAAVMSIPRSLTANASASPGSIVVNTAALSKRLNPTVLTGVPSAAGTPRARLSSSSSDGTNKVSVVTTQVPACATINPQQLVARAPVVSASKITQLPYRALTLIKQTQVGTQRLSSAGAQQKKQLLTTQALAQQLKSGRIQTPKVGGIRQTMTARPMTETDYAQMMKQRASATITVSQAPQFLANTQIQQAGGQQVAALVKTVTSQQASSGTVTIPVTSVNLNVTMATSPASSQTKGVLVAKSSSGSTPVANPTVRWQQVPKKMPGLSTQRIPGQVAGQTVGPTLQLIPQSKSLPTPVTVQAIQQLMKQMSAKTVIQTQFIATSTGASVSGSNTTSISTVGSPSLTVTSMPITAKTITIPAVSVPTQLKVTPTVQSPSTVTMNVQRTVQQVQAHAQQQAQQRPTVSLTVATCTEVTTSATAASVLTSVSGGKLSTTSSSGSGNGQTAAGGTSIIVATSNSGEQTPNPYGMRLRTTKNN